MRTVDREELEYYICDVGIDAALKLLHLTDKQSDAIRYDKPLGEAERHRPRGVKYKPLAPPTTEDGLKLVGVIADNYKHLRRVIVRDKFTIDTRSLTVEDIFHNNLLSIMKGCDVFVFKNDDHALRFIMRTYKRDRFDEIKLCKLHQINMNRYKLIVKRLPKTCEAAIFL